MKANLPYNHIVTVKNGKHYVIFDYKDENNKRKRKWVTTGLPENCAKKALKAKVEEIVAAFHEAYYSKKAIAGSEANTAEEAPKIVLGNNKVYEFTEYLTKAQSRPYLTTLTSAICTTSIRSGSTLMRSILTSS